MPVSGMRLGQVIVNLTALSIESQQYVFDKVRAPPARRFSF